MKAYRHTFNLRINMFRALTVVLIVGNCCIFRKKKQIKSTWQARGREIKKAVFRIFLIRSVAIKAGGIIRLSLLHLVKGTILKVRETFCPEIFSVFFLR